MISIYYKIVKKLNRTAVIKLVSKTVPQNLSTFRRSEVVSVFIFVSLIKIKTNLLYKTKIEAYYLLKIQSILLIIKLFSVNTQRLAG
jgi:hypothetical protein